MLVENQVVEVKWNAKNVKHYESKGYTFTKTGESFLVKVEDLTRYSKVKVKVKCDYCGKTVEKNNDNFITENNNNLIKGIYKDACKDCNGIKTSENYGTELINENEVFEEAKCKIEPYTEEFLIAEFYRYKKEFDIYPRKIDIEGNTDFPSATSYYNKWGNWKNFLKDLNLIGETGLYKEDENVIKSLYSKETISVRDISEKLIEKLSVYEINKVAKKLGLIERNLLIERTYNLNLPLYDVFKAAIIDLNSDVGKCPSSMDYDAYAKLNKLPSRNLTERKVEKKYAVLCQEILGEANANHKSKETLTKELLELAKNLGRTPKANELTHHGLSTRKIYAKVFEMNFLDILKSIGLKPDASSDRVYLSNDELLDGFLKLYEELGYIPTWFDIDCCSYLPSNKTYINRFKSISNVCALLNLTQTEMNQDMSGGYVSRNINGELCRSVPELKISNFLIKSGLKYEDNFKYSQLDKTLKMRWTMDWYLLDLGICVEYFGMYDENQLNKKTITGKYTRKVKRKIKYCEENDIKLIDLYVDDLKENYKGLIKKFGQYGIFLEYQKAINI